MHNSINIRTTNIYRPSFLGNNRQENFITRVIYHDIENMDYKKLEEKLFLLKTELNPDLIVLDDKKNKIPFIEYVAKKEATVTESRKIIFQKLLERLNEIKRGPVLLNDCDNEENYLEESNSIDNLPQQEETRIKTIPIISSEKLKRYQVLPTQFSPKCLNDVGGMKEAKEAVKEYIINPWNPKYRKLIQENNVQMPNGFMLYGPPGNGKTYLVMAIAAQMGIPMLELDLSAIGSKYAYETENTIKYIFDELEKLYKNTKKPSILFMDELDSICANRASSNTDWKKDQINAILKLTNNASQKGIILIGATNLIEDLDPAIMRTGRFDKKIEIALPNEEERLDILTKLVKNRPMAENIKNQLSQIAKITEGKTCSDIVAIFHSAMRNAIFNNKAYISISDVEKAYKSLDYKPTKNITNI